MTNRPLLFVAVLFAFGVAVRLALVLLLRDVTVMPQGPESADDVEFNELARNVAGGEGYVNANGKATSFRAPGWPLFVAGLYALFGERAWVVYVASCLLGGASCVLAYLIARRLMSERQARLAGWLCVAFVPHALFCVMFWSENLFVPLFAAAVWLLVCSVTRPGEPTKSGCATAVSAVSAIPRPPGTGTHTADTAVAQTPRAAVLASAGLLLGAAALSRPFALLAVPLFALVLLGHLRWRGLLAGAILGLTAALVVAPWTYRNYRVHHRFVPVATNGGSTFYGGNNSLVAGETWQLGSWISTTDLPHRDEINAAPDEVAHDKVEWDLGVRWMKANPGKAVLLLPLKLLRLILWLPDFGIPAPLPIRAAAWLPFLLLIAVGLWRGRRSMTGPGWRLLHAAMLATALTALVFWGSPRFRDANAPLLMAYAALAFAPRRAAGAAPEARL
jgi:4-amino-4-deoxy-L-arabinose transferase-like glycosyltransferase